MEFHPVSRLQSLSRSFNGLGFVRLGSVALLGAVGTVLGWPGQAEAADTIELRYSTRTLTLSTTEIRQFANTGDVPSDLRLFFEDVDQVPGIARNLLVGEIRLPRVADEFLDSPTGGFVLLQLDRIVRNVEQSEDLESLRTAIAVAGADRSISVLEILEAYPADQVALDMRGLEQTYTQVSTFVERIEPAIATAAEFLRDIVCDCESPANTEPESADASVDVDEGNDMEPNMEPNMEPDMDTGVESPEPENDDEVLDETSSSQTPQDVQAVSASSTHCTVSTLTTATP